MSDNPLLKEVLDNPEDLGARQVYADWLIERDDPRGGFISQQIQLEQMTGWENEYPELLADSLRAEQNHAGEWLRPFLEACDLDRQFSRISLSSNQNAVFRNGFVQRIAISAEKIQPNWDLLESLEPVVGAEVIAGESIPDSCLELTQPRAWKSIKVSPDDWFTAYSVSRVLGWGLESIEELDLSDCDLGGDGARMLANMDTDLGDHFDDWKQPPPLNHAQIKSLALRNTNIMDVGLQLILGASDFEKLQTLDVSQCRLQDNATLKALFKLSLQKLKLSGNNNLDVSKLAGWEGLEKLQHLSVPQSIKPTAITKLFPKGSNELRSLNLASGKELAQELLTIAKLFGRLQSINLSTTRIGDKLFQSLCSDDRFDSLVHLTAGGCSLSDKSIEELAKSQLKRLVTLDLSSNKLTDDSLEKLAKWDGIKHVVHFRIGNNRKVSDVGYKYLIESKQFNPASLDIGKVKDEKITEPLKERFRDAVIYTT